MHKTLLKIPFFCVHWSSEHAITFLLDSSHGNPRGVGYCTQLTMYRYVLPFAVYGFQVDNLYMKCIPHFRLIRQNVYPISEQIGVKTIPQRVTHMIPVLWFEGGTPNPWAFPHHRGQCNSSAHSGQSVLKHWSPHISNHLSVYHMVLPPPPPPPPPHTHTHTQHMISAVKVKTVCPNSPSQPSDSLQKRKGSCLLTKINTVYFQHYSIHS